MLEFLFGWIIGKNYNNNNNNNNNINDENVTSLHKEVEPICKLKYTEFDNIHSIRIETIEEAYKSYDTFKIASVRKGDKILSYLERVEPDYEYDSLGNKLYDQI